MTLPAQLRPVEAAAARHVGEPINPEAWMWYHRVIGGGRCPIVDTWWQTETGAIMISPLPGVTATKPGSCTQPLPGIDADIVDDARQAGDSAPDAGGYLVIRKPWPSMLRTIWGDNERYLETYWEKFQNRYYVAGDSAHRDKDGYFWIMGRIDDVLNVAGHRLGTMEIESALVAHPRWPRRRSWASRTRSRASRCSRTWCAAASARRATAATLVARSCATGSASSSAPSRKPDDIRFADNLPKTRSGKIMRRLLRAIARGEEITQDISTLENPAIIDQLRGEDTPPPARRSKPLRKRKAKKLVKRKAAKALRRRRARKLKNAACGARNNFRRDAASTLPLKTGIYSAAANTFCASRHPDAHVLPAGSLTGRTLAWYLRSRSQARS